MTSPSRESGATPVDPRVIRFRPGLRREGDHPVRFCTIHGYRRAFVSFGKGPALLLIHGIGDSSDTWQPVLDELGRHHTIVAPDLLGHGRSEKPRADYSVAAYANGMRDLLSVLEIDRATVVGHSLGGGVAAQFAYQFPERCERLVLVDSGGIGQLREPVPPACGRSRGRGPDAAVRAASGAGGRPVRRRRCMRHLTLPLGRDAEELLAVFDALPDTAARGPSCARCVRGWTGGAR